MRDGHPARTLSTSHLTAHALMLVGLGLFGILAANAEATEPALLYERAQIRLMPAQATQANHQEDNREKDGEAPGQTAKAQAEPILRLKVTVRRDVSPRSPGWIIEEAPLAPGEGVLRLYEAPVTHYRPDSSLRRPVDMLFVDAYGYVHTIAKSLAPAQLRKPLDLAEPAHALLYLAAGTSAAHAISPGMRVAYTDFPSPPQVER